MNRQMAKLTAKWWRNKLEFNQHDNGERDLGNLMAAMLADTLAANNTPTADQLDAFEENLTELIMEYDGNTLLLNCDYNPCKMLYDAAISVGIDSSVFPWKTNSHTTKDEVKVSDGYGAPWEEIHESDFE